MQRAALALALASVGGLLVGAAVPSAEHLRQFALVSLFVQTMIAVGGLAEAHSDVAAGWPLRMFLTHHAVSSIPLMALGVVLGLGTPLGAGTFLLGAVPPAVALPSYAAACAGRVRPVVQFCILSYAVGIVLTPLLVLVALGTTGRIGSMVLTLLFGLMLPATLGTLTGRWLRRVPQGASFAIIAASVSVLMLGMGSELRLAYEVALEQPSQLWIAALIGVGRCLWGASLGWVVGRGGSLQVESALAGGCKNAVLAAVIAHAAVGSLAALPALLGLFAEAGVLFAASVLSVRSRSRPLPPPSDIW
ncbi:MAG: hypothetical protein ACRDO1_09355 [Nocardioidaceae bacterium]